MAKKNEIKKKVFISHSSSDKWISEQIQDNLTRAGIDSFLNDTSLDIVEDFELQIKEELKKSDELLVLITPAALARPYIWLEIGAAWIYGIKIIGVVQGITIEEISTNPQYPVLIKKCKLLYLNDFEKYLQQAKSIKP